MPQYLYKKIINSRKILIETEMTRRIEIIKEEYLKDNYTKEEIIESIKKLERYIGKNQIDEFINCIKEEKFDEVIKKLIENHYDRVYSTKYKDFEKMFFNDNEEVCANKISIYLGDLKKYVK